MFILLITTVLASNYKIPSYYGSMEQDFLLRESILDGDISSFYWYSTVAQFDDVYYVADSNAIWHIAGSNNKRMLVSGISKTSGYRDGDAANALFGKITSVVYFKMNEQLVQQERNKKVVILTNNSTTCLTTTIDNYYKCQDNTTATVDPYLIAEYYPNAQTSTIEHKEYIYVVDSSNHCIRRVDLAREITSTIAGKCGIKGFKDGLLGISLFNSPDQMGIDVLGNIFVYDRGNHFIRMISPNGLVSTLINGACRQDVRYSGTPRRVICIKKWIKVDGEPSEHIVTVSYDICTKHFTDC